MLQRHARAPARPSLLCLGPLPCYACGPGGIKPDLGWGASNTLCAHRGLQVAIKHSSGKDKQGMAEEASKTISLSRSCENMVSA